MTTLTLLPGIVRGTQPYRLPFKRVNETVKHSLDWIQKLGGESISTSEWSAQSGITLSNSTITLNITNITVSGGSGSTDYELVNKITTSGGRTLEQAVMLHLEDNQADFAS